MNEAYYQWALKRIEEITPEEIEELLTKHGIEFTRIGEVDGQGSVVRNHQGTGTDSGNGVAERGSERPVIVEDVPRHVGDYQPHPCGVHGGSTWCISCSPHIS